MRVSNSMQLRIQVLRATVFLAVARFLVRFVPLRIWRSSLGVVDDAPALIDWTQRQCDLATLRRALTIGRVVDRAAEILPGLSRCLPKAVALQWILRMSGIPAALVIAFHLEDRTGRDAYHAWVERDGEMLVGQCDRESYRAILTFVTGARPVQASSPR